MLQSIFSHSSVSPPAASKHPSLLVVGVGTRVVYVNKGLIDGIIARNNGVFAFIGNSNTDAGGTGANHCHRFSAVGGVQVCCWCVAP